ncbi:hypothetical protein ACRALDRAFT_2054622 [Sodiomyces alcalophilus JCM 7366]|uniref:uncharacterized protein n=1 Tax=Sodiomyces alcalophilus JCM 7366 TaxID=591952 RepID=UPI0039B3AB49
MSTLNPSPSMSQGVLPSDMALLNPTFIFGILVLIYLSTFVLFALLRVATGISIQRIGYFSLRRLAYTPKDGFKIEIRGLGLNVHRPTFAQPTWLSIVINELVVTVDLRQLDGKRADDDDSSEEDDKDKNSDSTESQSDGSTEEQTPRSHPKIPQLRRNGVANARSEIWKHLTKLKERVKRVHRQVKWLRMVDVVATNSTVNIVDVGNIQCGSLTLAVDTRRKMFDRARFFFQFRTDKKKNQQQQQQQQQQQAEWIVTLRSVLFTAEGNESLEVLDQATLNIHGFLYGEPDGLRDASIALKLNRIHIPYDDLRLCAQRIKQCRSPLYAFSAPGDQPRAFAKIRADPRTPSLGPDPGPDIFPGLGSGPGITTEDDIMMQAVSDSKEFISSILRGIKEVQFAVSFVGLTKKVESVTPRAQPLLLNASMKEVGIDLHRLDPKSPAHRMYFPSKDIAHEALAAALSISVGLDDGDGKPERLLYIPMTTTTVKTTLPSKTVELANDVDLGSQDKNTNILFANSVITSPSVDLDPRHLPLLVAMLRPKPKTQPQTIPRRPGQGHLLISRLLPKANIKLTMHEPVMRIALPAVDKAAAPDDYDLIISSISSISLDLESSHSAFQDLHYSLASSMRLQSHHLYYQTSDGGRFDLVETENFDLKVQLSAAPDVHVVASGNVETFTIKMVRSEIIEGLSQIIRQLRPEVQPDKKRHAFPTMTTVSPSGHRSLLRAMPSWLLQFQMQASDVSLEVAGVDQDISDETRGVSLQIDTFSSEYRAQRLEGLQRRPSRRRTNSRSIAPDADLLKAPLSPRRKQQNHGDGRTLAVHVRGLEAYIVEAADCIEPAPFVDVPRFEISFSALSDQQGPIFQIHTGIRTIKLQYSLYRHYSVVVAATVLRKAFTRTGKDGKASVAARSSTVPRRDSDAHLLVPPASPYADPDDFPFMGRTTSELITVDVKASMIQIKADLPRDPAMLIQVYDLNAGRNRWAAPFFSSKQILLCVQPPRMRGVWARMLCVRGARVDYRISRRKTSSGGLQEDNMIDLTSESVRFAVPHEVILNKVSDNLVNVFKSVQQLHHRFKTGTNEYILDKLPEGPKNVPKVSIRTKVLLFELEDGAFEWKLGMIYRTGRVEQAQRLAREKAFEIKRKKVREEESRRESHKHRARSLFHRARGKHGNTRETRSHSADRESKRNSGDHDDRRGRTPRYDPEGGCHGLTGHAKIAEQEARARLDMYNATSWKKRIDRHYAISRKTTKEARGHIWESDQLFPDDLEEAERILEVPQRPALMATVVHSFHLLIDKPTFPMRDLPDFIHEVGKGMPKDMQYGLLVPMHVSIDVGETKVSLRDYPLPLIHIPGLKLGQSQRLSSMSLRSNFVIAEEYRGTQSTRRIKVDIIPPRSRLGLGPDSGKPDGGFAIDVRRTIGPIKSYSDIRIEINTALPTRMTWGGPCYQPAMQDMMMVIESFTKPQIDPSERVGFWDKIRLNFHSRIRVAWKNDGDLHLALKGSRDPYCVTGNGAGFIMCWRNDIRWNINTEDDPKRLMTVESGEYVLAIPDYSYHAREANRLNESDDSPLGEETYRQGVSFQKVIMKLSGKVQWMTGLVFERAIEGGNRSFDFKPHYDVVLRAPQHARPSSDGLPYDAFRGFRSHHIHLSIDVRAPVDRDWMASNPEPSRSYNAVHCTPRFFTHFFAWWALFGGPMSLPIRQGPLWPGRERNSKKFGKHLATIKYNLLFAPLFLSHIYKHKDMEDYPEDAVSATGIKVRFDSFKLDIHQRREEFNTRVHSRKTQSRTSGIKIHAAQLDLTEADVRAVSASIRGTTEEAIRKRNIANLTTDQTTELADLSRFTIPDNDLTWIDMDDFVELGWILPAESNPDTKILPLAYAPRLTYFRQTDIGGAISGDPDRTSPFGQEPTHFCMMSQDDDPRKVQEELIKERLAQLEVQIENHGRNVGEAELRVVRDDGKDPDTMADFEALRRHTGVLRDKKTFLEGMARQLSNRSPSSSQVLASKSGSKGEEGAPDTSIDLDHESMTLPSGAEFESDAQNRFVIHNLHFKWNNLLRNVILRYTHQVSQRRGFIYYLSRPAVKFILDIVEEQYKAKFNHSKPSNNGPPGAGASPSSGKATDREVEADIEEKIKRILQDGRRFVNADQEDTSESSDKDNSNKTNINKTTTTNVAMEDLMGGISNEFRPQSSYHVRIIAPQIQLQSDKNKKNVVLMTAKGMELKVVEVMDKERLSDAVSGLVQRRFLVSMDSTQFFVTHEKWFLTNLVSMYAGSRYGTPATSSWPPWVPMEVMFDFRTDPFGFKRVVQKSSAMLRYDKYNTLRLKYNDEVNTDDANGKASSSQPSAERRVDNLWVEFPRARALCNSSQYYAMYVIVFDLLMYSEPLEKTRTERLEKIMLASDFSDLSGAPEMVEKLQERIRQLEDIKTHFQVYSQYLDERGWEDRLALERDLAACEDELFFMMKAITTSQRRYDTNNTNAQSSNGGADGGGGSGSSGSSSSNALLRWSITAKDIVWHLLRDTNEPLVELQLRDVEYDRTDHSDGSHSNLIRVGKVLGLNLLPNAIYPAMVAPYVDVEQQQAHGASPNNGDNGGGNNNSEMIRVYWNMLEAIAGIPVMDHFEVNLFPMKIQLEHEVGKRLFEYIFPDVEGGKGGQEGDDSPFIVKQSYGDEDEDGGDDSAGYLTAHQLADKDGFNTRAGSLELRLRPTLASDAATRPKTAPKKTHGIHVGDGHGHGHGHGFRLFRSGTAATAKMVSKKASYDSLRSSDNPKMGVIRTSTGTSLSGGNTEKKSRFRRRAEKDDEPSDDLTKMMARANSYMSFAHVKMPSVVLCLSYKGKDSRNFEDVHDFVFRLPTLEWRNKTWSNLDLALALKKAVIKALISHTGAIIGNKFKVRPNTAQTTRLRELANNSSLIASTAAASSGSLQQQQQQQNFHYADSMDSDDSSSFFDFSRSPPRSRQSSIQSMGIGMGMATTSVSALARSNTSRSSSAASSRRSPSYRNSSGGSNPLPSQLNTALPPSLVMTAPSADGDTDTTFRFPPRPVTSGGLSPYDSGGGSTQRRLGTRESARREFDRRRSAGGEFLRDKFSALTSRMREGSTSGGQKEEEGGEEQADSETGGVGRKLGWAGRTRTG